MVGYKDGIAQNRMDRYGQGGRGDNNYNMYSVGGQVMARPQMAPIMSVAEMQEREAALLRPMRELPQAAPATQTRPQERPAPAAPEFTPPRRPVSNTTPVRGQENLRALAAADQLLSLEANPDLNLGENMGGSNQRDVAMAAALEPLVQGGNIRPPKMQRVPIRDQRGRETGEFRMIPMEEPAIEFPRDQRGRIISNY